MRYRPDAVLPLLLCVAAVACRDGQPVSARSLAPPSVSYSASAAPTDFDYFSADVTLTYSGGGITKSQELPPRTIAFRTERQLNNDGYWTSTLTLSKSGLALETPSANRVAKFVFEEATGKLHAFDGAGVERELPTPEKLQALLGTQLSPPHHRHPQGLRGPATNPRDWADAIMSSPEARLRQRALMERALGKPSEDSPGRRVYRAERGDRSLEIVTDPKSNLVVEQNVGQHGVRSSHTTYTYQETAPGVYLRTGVRSEVAAADNRSRSLVMEQHYANVRFERHGGQP